MKAVRHLLTAMVIGSCGARGGRRLGSIDGGKSHVRRHDRRGVL